MLLKIKKSEFHKMVDRLCDPGGDEEEIKEEIKALRSVKTQFGNWFDIADMVVKRNKPFWEFKGHGIWGPALSDKECMAIVKESGAKVFPGGYSGPCGPWTGGCSIWKNGKNVGLQPAYDMARSYVHSYLSDHEKALNIEFNVRAQTWKRITKKRCQIPLNLTVSRFLKALDRYNDENGYNLDEFSEAMSYAVYLRQPEKFNHLKPYLCQKRKLKNRKRAITT